MKLTTLLLDRDGTLIEDPGYLCDPDAVTLLPGVVEGLSRFRDAGCRFCIVTNQSGIDRELYTEAAFQACNDRLMSLLAEHDITITALQFCPHVPEAQCSCRKPQTGMWDALVSTLPDLVPEQCCMVGDKDRDVQFGQNVGCQTARIDSGQYPTTMTADYTVRDLRELADLLIPS